MKRFILTALLLLCILLTHAQQRITGRVVDSETSEPIINASIKLLGTNRGTVTDAQGLFSIETNSGDAMLLISYVGYNPVQVSAGQDLLIELTPGKNLEGIIIQGVRAEDDDPVTQTTVHRKEIEQEYNGEQPIFLLEKKTPSIFTYSESGTKVANYGNLRLRGMSQERINMTLNGIPLNDMIDHGVFFSNFTDIANSFESIQVQRGVGTSSNGSASYAGSINFESVNLEGREAGGELQLGAGSFSTYRANANLSTGMIEDKWSFYGSYSRLFSDGYRDNTFTDARSFFFSGGYFGTKDAVKVTAFDSRSRNGLGYSPVALSDLKVDPTTNYLDENDTDDFGQQLVQLQHSHVFSDQFKTVASLYYGGSGGDFLYTYNDTDSTKTQINYPLSNDHYGLLINGFWNSSDNKWKLSSGVHAYIFDRVNEESISPDFENPYYHETSTKNEFSWFGKIEWQTNDWLLFADLQVRTQKLIIRPDYSFIGIAPEGDITKDWTFVNPKIGLSYAFNSNMHGYASFGRTGREPAKIDILGGSFNINSDNLELARSDAFDTEYVNDFETGVRVNTNRLALAANYFYMDFQNEIAPIGEIVAFGVQKRANIPDSYRTGVELTWNYSLSPRLRTTGNLTYMKSKIQDFTTAEGVNYRNTTPLLSPEIMANIGLSFEVIDELILNFSAAHVGESYLDLSNDPEFVLPDFWLGNARVNYRWKSLSVSIEANNLFDKTYYTNGSVLGTEPGYLANAGRNYFITTKFNF